MKLLIVSSLLTLLSISCESSNDSNSASDPASSTDLGSCRVTVNGDLGLCTEFVDADLSIGESACVGDNYQWLLEACPSENLSGTCSASTLSDRAVGTVNVVVQYYYEPNFVTTLAEGMCQGVGGDFTPAT